MKSLGKQQGLTLIELLVTMVIMGFVMATLSGAMTQISQMLRISTEQSNGFLNRWTQSRALYDIVANMVADPTQDQPFKGTPKLIELVSIATPDAPMGPPKRLSIQLASDKNQINQTFIQLYDLEDTNTKAPHLTLASFQGRIEFRYLDKEQKEHSLWPVNNGQQTQQLPSAVLIRDMDKQDALIRIAGYMGPINPGNPMGQLMLGRP